ncbi:MAG TPA: hypothetical protein VJU87_12015 [Gemmatimonadaceae bacterium]|nr:hypothetical protein [Gemmatimonadaceae bacterium]
MAGDPNLPVSSPRFDRAALERVLARAAELASGMGESEEVLTEEQIVELGQEVGLSPQHLRQALAEERTRIALPPDTHGVTGRVFGGARVSASRTVPGRLHDVLAAMDSWMLRQECLQVKRQFPDRIVWEPQRGFVSLARRTFNVGGRSYALSHAFEVAATAVSIEDSRTLVRLDADLDSFRSSLAKQSLGISALGAASTGTLAMLGFALPFAAIPVVVFTAGAIYGARGVNARVVSSAQLALEQLLDRLERGELTRAQPSSLLSALAAAAATLPKR